LRPGLAARMDIDSNIQSNRRVRLQFSPAIVNLLNALVKQVGAIVFGIRDKILFAYLFGMRGCRWP
jgi:hypothetical protein